MRVQDITLDPGGKRSGQPCIRGIRITVYDVLSYLAASLTSAEVLDPYLTNDDLLPAFATQPTGSAGPLRFPLPGARALAWHALLVEAWRR